MVTDIPGPHKGQDGLAPVCRRVEAPCGPALRSLSSLAEGEGGTVAHLEGGRAFQSRLISMGLAVGHRVRVVRGNPAGGGPVLVAAGGTRLAVGRGMADKILIRADSA